ncbi:MAG: type II toxin-antitoxin system VapC family toxin [Geminicoccaceae bacterium]
MLIDVSRGRDEARRFLSSIRNIPLQISAVTVAEFCGGLRKGRERAWFDDWLATVGVFDVTAEVARLGGFYWRDYRSSHGVRLLDALIAATAKIHRVRLVTRNLKHFPMLDDVVAPYSLN